MRDFVKSFTFESIFFSLFLFCVTFTFGPLRELDYLKNMPGDLIDSRLNNYFLENIYQYLMGGSNSIKRVLPSVLRESHFLKNKYSKAIYGIGCEISSLNFPARAWIQTDEHGKVKDPYKSLEPIFNDATPEQLAAIDRVFNDDEIREGGAASTAYARMQLTRMSEEERSLIAKALLKYCELDTLAMVMIWEYWTQELVKNASKAA